MRRVALAAGAAACMAVATVGTVDPDVPLSATARSLAVAAGLLLASGVAWFIGRTRHTSLTRDEMIPWWIIGASALVLALAARVVPLWDHGMFVTVTVLRAGLAALGCRIALDAIRGPLPEVPWWADEEDWLEIERAARRSGPSFSAEGAD